MVTRREFLAFSAAAPLVGAARADRIWTPLDRAGRDIFGGWESPATGHFVRISSAGVEIFHRLDTEWFRDPGLTPPFSLFARDGDMLSLQHYDYRGMPFLLQAPATLRRSSATVPTTVLTQNDRIAPASLFDMICRSFARHYAFFTERGVDWSEARRAMASRSLDSDDAAFDALAAMLGRLGDGHVNLSHGDRAFNAGRPGLRMELAKAWQAQGSVGTEQAFVANWSRDSRASALSLLDPGTLGTAANGALEWGRIGKAGYLRINRFSGFVAGDASRDRQLTAFARAFVDAEAAFAGTRHLIVDVAHNGGGNDAAAMVAARHFADRARHVLTYASRGMPEQRIQLAPAAEAYPRPILLLTSEITASAAECFVAMMRAFPHVTQAGGATRGILSSLLPKPFPNGFMATIAYQRVLDAQDRLHEARGIPPTREIALFPTSDLKDGYRSAIRTLAQAGSSFMPSA